MLCLQTAQSKQHKYNQRVIQLNQEYRLGRASGFLSCCLLADIFLFLVIQTFVAFLNPPCLANL